MEYLRIQKVPIPKINSPGFSYHQDDHWNILLRRWLEKKTKLNRLTVFHDCILGNGLIPKSNEYDDHPSAAPSFSNDHQFYQRIDQLEGKNHTPTTWSHIFPCLLANLQQRSLVRSLHKKYQRCEEGWTITFNKCSARLEQNLKATQFTMQQFKKKTWILNITLFFSWSLFKHKKNEKILRLWDSQYVAAPNWFSPFVAHPKWSQRYAILRMRIFQNHPPGCGVCLSSFREVVEQKVPKHSNPF